VKIYKTKDEFIEDSDKHFAIYHEFADSIYGFLIKDAKRFEMPIPMKGSLNFFNVDIVV
jgi:hypothetical protein